MSVDSEGESERDVREKEKGKRFYQTTNSFLWVESVLSLGLYALLSLSSSLSGHEDSVSYSHPSNEMDAITFTFSIFSLFYSIHVHIFPSCLCMPNSDVIRLVSYDFCCPSQSMFIHWFLLVINIVVAQHTILGPTISFRVPSSSTCRSFAIM